ncbi:MAG: tyrosine-type recombinase/integrase [Clostridia bacterium]|jgi:integrase|nr:tyrosine-type recombinase/integrase [Clostridia bacterium]
MTETLNNLIHRIEHDLKNACLGFAMLKGYLDRQNEEPPRQNCGGVNNGDALTTPQEGQMLIDIAGVSINSKPRKDGRFQGYAVTEEGRPKYFYGKSREEVAQKISDFLKGVQKTKRKTGGKTIVTFGEFYEKWLELYKKPNLKPTSITNIVDTLKPALAKFADVPITKIMTDDVQALLLSIKSPNTRGKCKVNINQIFTRAHKSGLIKINPCDNLEIKKHQDRHVDGLTPDQQQTFLGATSKSKYSLLFRLLLAAGVRVGEALALYKSDVDFDKCTLSITKDVIFIKGKRIEQPPKTKAAVRVLPLPQGLCEELKTAEEGLLFPFTYNSVRLTMQRIAEKLGFNVTAHVLRHTFCDRLQEAGVPDKVMQYLMGHSKLDTTKNKYTEAQAHYINAFSDSVRGCFDTFFDSKKP